MEDRKIGVTIFLSTTFLSLVCTPAFAADARLARRWPSG